jgi:hypothetical protein
MPPPHSGLTSDSVCAIDENQSKLLPSRLVKAPLIDYLQEVRWLKDA